MDKQAMSSNSPRDSTSITEQQKPSEDGRPDVAAAVDELLNKLSNSFTTVSNEMLKKMDEMARRIDKLEAELVESKAKEGNSSKTQ